MGPHSSEQGNRTELGLPANYTNASMGPHSSEQGNPYQRSPTPYVNRASMGPHSSEQGNSGALHLWGRALSCFNGASLFRARKPASASTSQAAPRRFNGASLFRARKPEHEQVIDSSLDASMGPHSSEQGNFATRISASPTCRGFNGASLFRARKRNLHDSAEVACFRFNGASLFRARKPCGATPERRRHCPASMGPHSSEQGNYPRSREEIDPLRALQWGLTLPSKETSLW